MSSALINSGCQEVIAVVGDSLYRCNRETLPDTDRCRDHSVPRQTPRQRVRQLEATLRDIIYQIANTRLGYYGDHTGHEAVFSTAQLDRLRDILAAKISCAQQHPCYKSEAAVRDHLEVTYHHVMQDGKCVRCGSLITFDPEISYVELTEWI